jgi:hypothetical protein
LFGVGQVGEQGIGQERRVTGRLGRQVEGTPVIEDFVEKEQLVPKG